MLSSLRRSSALRSLFASCSASSSSSSSLSTAGPLRSLLLSSSSGSSAFHHHPSASSSCQHQQIRHRGTLAPRRTKYRKAFKGRIGIRTGGSTSGTTLEIGQYGIRVNEPVRLSAKQLQSAQDALKRGIKPVKGAKAYCRVFPDIPVCIKGNETRMGKGKGTFEFWACRAPVGKVIFEVGGGGIAEQVAKDALRLASAKLPVTTEFVTRSSLPRVGSITVPRHSKPQDHLDLLSPEAQSHVAVPVEALVSEESSKVVPAS